GGVRTAGRRTAPALGARAPAAPARHRVHDDAPGDPPLRAAGRVPARAGVAAPGRVPRRRPPSLTGAGAASGLLGACVGAGRLLEPVDRLVDGREPRLGEAQLAREERDLAAQL